MKPSLLILAAGMGSRYGGIKQIEPVGAHGETILEYSIFDAIRAGFGKVIFVIRRDIQKDFDELVIPKFSAQIPCEYVFQKMSDLPSGFEVPVTRKKPWGTAHAVLSARSVLSEPFAVINADDFYGHEAFQAMSEFLCSKINTEKSYATVGYRLANTVSDNGTVSRGVCQVDSSNMLQGISEHTKIEKRGNAIISHYENGVEQELPADTAVSMNFFGFTPAIFPEMEQGFIDFLRTQEAMEKGEYFIPLLVDSIIKANSTVQVLNSNAQWFGITYKEDRPHVEAGIRGLVQAGTYPARLWG